MTSHFFRRYAWVALITSLVLVIPAAKATPPGLQLAPGLTAEQETAIYRQIEATLAASASGASQPQPRVAECLPDGPAPCDGAGPFSQEETHEGTQGAIGRSPGGMQLEDDSWREFIERRMAVGPPVTPEMRREDPNHWRHFPQTGTRSPHHRALNRDTDAPLTGWTQELGVAGRGHPQRPILVLIRNGRVEAGWQWRDDVSLARSAPLFRHDSRDRLASGAALGEFFRHASRMETDALRWVPGQWPGVHPDGWHLFPHGPAGGSMAPERSPLSAPDPWDFRR